MRFKKILFLILLVVAFLIGTLLNSFHRHHKPPKHPAGQTTKILVSIKPIYSLVLGLTKNVPKIQTELLLPPPNSPHTFHLKPSDVSKIVEANLIIWVGPELENFLINPLTKLKSKKQILTLIEETPLELLSVRQDEHWEQHEHHEHDSDAPHTHDHDFTIDPHIWLNTHNAKQIVLTLSQALQTRDPMHRAIYIENTQNLVKQLDKLHIQIENNLKSVHRKPFLVFHDAYQYFEKEFGLKALGSITLNPQVPLSAKRLNALQNKIKQEDIQCVFSEPEFSQTLVQKLLDHTSIKNSELDPLGAHIKMQAGHEEVFYLDLMRGLGNSFKACLSSTI